MKDGLVPVLFLALFAFRSARAVNPMLLIDLVSQIPDGDAMAAGEDAYRKMGFNDKSTEELVTKAGYPFEQHWTRTTDGYWLRLHRIPHGKHETADEAKNKTKEVFFLQHGLTASSSNFAFKDECLAFTLADQNYDVWMGNVRGNFYSRRHDFHRNDSAEFWDFSFDDMAKYDLPAMIDKTLELTKQENLWYVGHSQGTMIMFAKLSDDPEFGNKLRAFFALAPVARLDHVYNPIKTFARFFYGSRWLWAKSSIHKIPLPYHALMKLIKVLCIIDESFCGIMYSQWEEFNKGVANFDWKKLPQVLSELFTEGDACLKNLYHYCQAIETGKFQKYDYGMLGNLLHYYQTTPPEYDMANIRTYTWVFSGTMDILATPTDVNWIYDNLPEEFRVEHKVYANYTHLDFLWDKGGKDGKKPKPEVYEKIIDIARKLEFT